MIIKVIVATLLGLVTLLMISFIFKGMQSRKMTPRLGLKDGKLTPCAEKPNCVCSQSPTDDKTHAMQPVPIATNPITRLKEIATKMGLAVQDTQPTYLYLTHTSKLFGFVDDIEFSFLESEGMLHFRSASRVGYSDMGQNRKRIGQILGQLTQ